jgi:hypothetical protein
MSKNTIFVCFALCLLFQFSGCSLFSEKEAIPKSNKNSKISETKVGDNDDTPVNKTGVVAAQRRLEEANNRLNTLENSLRQKASEATQERTKCESMKALSEKNKKDYNDPQTDTFKQCLKADALQKEYKEKLQPAKNEVEEAKSAFQVLQQSPPTPTPVQSPNNESFKGSDLLFPLLIGLAGLLLIGGISFLIYRISKNNKHERDATQDGFRSISAKQSGLRQDVDQLKTATELLSKQLSEQRNEIAALKSLGRRENSITEPPPAPQTFSPSFTPPAPEFPVSVETYLAKNGGGAAFGKHDPLFGTLKENNDDGAFYLVRDGVLSDDSRYAVPRTKQFVTKDDFVYHYNNYYVCANPSGGEVWIKKPSTVKRTADGWKLEVTGELEIR